MPQDRVLEKQIKDAIGAHGLWKSRLVGAIDTGKADVSVETAGSGTQCAFGKWLGGVKPAGTQSASHAKVKQLHDAFHRVAANVLAHATAGRKTEASKAIASNGEFDRASFALTREMMAWLKAA